MLDAFESSMLRVQANSCALARWDTRLGFGTTPYISTLRALAPDGGAAPMMRIRILRVFNLGYIDTSPAGSGSSAVPSGGAESQRSASGSGNGTSSGAPRRPAATGMATARSEAEEAQAAAEWANEREEWREKLQEAWNDKLRRTHLVVQLLVAARRVAGGENRANGGTTHGAGDEDDEDGDAMMMDEAKPAYGFDTESVLDRLETSSDPSGVLRTVPRLAARLPELIGAATQRQTALQREAHVELEAELDEKVAPRHVRSFRVVRFADYVPEAEAEAATSAVATMIKPCARMAQLTVWDAARLEGIAGAAAEGGGGDGGGGGGGEVQLREGNVFAVTNLVPTSVGSWRSFEDPAAEVFLATRRDTSWIPLALPK